MKPHVCTGSQCVRRIPTYSKPLKSNIKIKPFKIDNIRFITLLDCEIKSREVTSQSLN